MSNLIISCNENGNAVFHIGLSLDGSLQPIINAVLPFSNMELMMQLLNTNRPGGAFYDVDENHGYFFMYDNNMKKPYPSVMIWKYIHEGDNRVIADMEKDDLSIIKYAVETYLR